MKIGMYGSTKRKIAVSVVIVLLLIWNACQPTWAVISESFQYEEKETLTEENLGDISDEEWEQFMDSYQEDILEGDLESLFQAESIVVSELLLENAGQGMIRFTLPNRVSFVSSVPNGMVTDQEVRIELPDEAIGTVQKDGEEAFLLDDGVFTETGEYELKLVFYQMQSSESEDYNIYEVHFSFTIIDEMNNSLEVINAPEEFEITEVFKNGVLQNGGGKEICSFPEDGNYEIHFYDRKTGSIHLVTQFTKDTEAPFLTFSKDITEKSVTGPVEFTVSEPDCTVMVTYNGNRGQLMTNTLASGGFYELEVIDLAGNSRTYQFNIRQTYKLFDTKLVIMACIGFAGLAAWLVYLRNHMRVM